MNTKYYSCEDFTNRNNCNTDNNCTWDDKFNFCYKL